MNTTNSLLIGILIIIGVGQLFIIALLGFILKAMERSKPSND